MGCFEHRGEDHQGRVEGMRGAGSIVQAIGNVVEFGLRVDGQVGPYPRPVIDNGRCASPLMRQLS